MPGQARQVTKGVKEKRLDTLYRLLLKGATRYDIIQMAKKEWGIKSDAVDKHLTVVYKEFRKEYGKKHRHGLIDKHLAQLSDLYVKNYEKGDYRECRALVETINRMLGLDAAQKVEVHVEKKPFELVLSGVEDADVASEKQIQIADNEEVREEDASRIEAGLKLEGK